MLYCYKRNSNDKNKIMDVKINYLVGFMCKKSASIAIMHIGKKIKKCIKINYV